MTKLLEHFKAIQDMASRYLEPTGSYVDREGGEFTNIPELPERRFVEQAAFINDVLYMLDGPEQRAAQRLDIAERQALQNAFDDIKAEFAEMRDKVAVANSDRGRATAKLEVVKTECNDLRDRLMESELSRSRMTGYLARVEDETPPRMVAQERPRFFESHDARVEMPRNDFAGYSSNRDQPKRWFHR